MDKLEKNNKEMGNTINIIKKEYEKVEKELSNNIDKLNKAKSNFADLFKKLSIKNKYSESLKTGNILQNPIEFLQKNNKSDILKLLLLDLELFNKNFTNTNNSIRLIHMNLHQGVLLNNINQNNIKLLEKKVEHFTTLKN